MAQSQKRRPRKRKKHPSLRRVLRIFLVVIILVFVGVAAWGCSAAVDTPSWDPAVLDNPKQSSRIYDLNGEVIAQLHAGENRLNVSSADIPDLVKQTFVAIEDKRFYSHFGFDPIRIVGAGVRDLLSRSAKEGASTITIQLARNAFISDPTAKTLTRKVQEVVLAMQLEHKYTKDEILTFYLNRIYLGESCFGILAASQVYFGKEDLSELTPDEVALLAGLPQAPSGYDPYVYPDEAKSRRTVVLSVMRDADIISATAYEQYKETPFSYIDHVTETRGGAEKPTTTGVGYQFPYYVDYVIDELENTYHITAEQIFSGGLQIYTAIDPAIQKEAEAAFANDNNFPQSVDNVKVQAAITILDPATGAIRAMVGGRDYTPRGLNRAWAAKRQPGSTIKPLVVYAPALEKGGFFPGTVLDDMPVSYSTGGGSWSPVDFDTETSGWKGLITMRYAVENSVNVYAVKLMNLIGVEYGWSFAKDKLGLPLKNDERNNLSLALGSTNVSTVDMASAYGVFANNGVRITHHVVEKVLDAQDRLVIEPTVSKQRVMSETTAYLMNNLLRGVVTGGTGVNAQIGNWYVCGKTGTTSLDPEKYGYKNGNPDAWFAGYTPNYVGVVWMGYDVDLDSNHYLRQVYGGSYPTRIWKQTMTAALQGKEVISAIPQPAGIVSGSFDRKSGLLPSSLTPSQFISSEIAAQGNLPSKPGTVWVEKDIDAAHPEYLAGPATAVSRKGVFLEIPGRSPNAVWPTEEHPYKPPVEYTPEELIDPKPETPPSETPATTPDRNHDSSVIPTPAISKITYKTATREAILTVAVPVERSAETSASGNAHEYTIVIYLQRPGSSATETLLTKIKTSGAPGTMTACPVALGEQNEMTTGEYAFQAALQDSSATIGPASKNAILTLK
ncbi:MAG: PBP1A family penicillin-binding protein [Peptococcaceae bacterium]|jgi:penicillin-binding protein 1A|nr:PBP1A family penicillin-binding protein [Peptococcaceae bacterium]